MIKRLCMYEILYEIKLDLTNATKSRGRGNKPVLSQ